MMGEDIESKTCMLIMVATDGWTCHKSLSCFLLIQNIKDERKAEKLREERSFLFIAALHIPCLVLIRGKKR